VKPITEVGGTKRVDLNVIAQLQPDLIIAEKEENPREMVESLSQIAPVFVTDVVDVASAYEMISRLAELIGKPEQGMSLQREIQNEWSHMIADAPSKRVAYLIWRKPWMAAGPQTYINSLLKTAGWINVCADPHAPSASRYPEISLELLAEKKVDYVLLSSEPYPFQEKHLSEVKSALPQARVLLTDGEPWSWYGSRMRRFPALLKSLHESLANRA
jgi:ABC-type Fe3+-hydroxamate transport system substrate-binding protein